MIWIEKLFVKADMDVDEERKQLFLALGLMLSVPILFIFACMDLMEGSRFEGIFGMGIVPVFIIHLIVMKTMNDIIYIARISTFLVLMLLSYELYIGGGNGYAFVWFYPIPLGVFFLFGKKEGSIWILSSFATLFIVLVLNLSRYSYDSSSIPRFLVSYAMVAIFSYGIEFYRYRYYKELLEEKELLEKATQEIKRLTGLLPICSSCKKIRDKKGYWNQIEDYVNEHCEVKLTHSICPECVNELYSDFDLDEGED